MGTTRLRARGRLDAFASRLFVGAFAAADSLLFVALLNYSLTPVI